VSGAGWSSSSQLSRARIDVHANAARSRPRLLRWYGCIAMPLEVRAFLKLCVPSGNASFAKGHLGCPRLCPSSTLSKCQECAV
jgi:hypothetical protein